MTHIYLIRHAEAEGNLYRRVHGQYDSYITENGVYQIGLLGERLAGMHFDRIYSSDLRRAMATARAALRPGGPEITPDPMLREMDLGEWEDRTWGELPLLYPGVYRDWCECPGQAAIPGGESMPALYARVSAALIRIAKDNPEASVAVFTHGAALRAMLCFCSGLPVERICEIGWCNNTAISHITYENGRFTVWVINDDAHIPPEKSVYTRQRWWKNEQNDIENLWFSPVRADEPALLDKLSNGDLYTPSFKYGDDNFSAPELAAFAIRGAEPCGYVLSQAEPGALVIKDMYLQKDVRGVGFGFQCVGHCVSLGRRLGLPLLSASVALDNTAATGLFTALGFTGKKAGGQILFTKSNTY